MTPSQKKALENHRQRQKKKGLIRMEINVPDRDRELLRAMAARLRAGGSVADQLRNVLDSTLKGNELIDFKRLLEIAPLEGVDLERSMDTGRDLPL